MPRGEKIPTAPTPASESAQFSAEKPPTRDITHQKIGARAVQSFANSSKSSNKTPDKSQQPKSPNKFKTPPEPFPVKLNARPDDPEEIKDLKSEVRQLFQSDYEGQKPYSPEGLADLWFQFSQRQEFQDADKVADLLEKTVWGPDLSTMDLTDESDLKRAVQGGFTEKQIVSRLLVGKRYEHDDGTPYYLQAYGQDILPRLDFLKLIGIRVDANEVARHMFVETINNSDVDALCSYGADPNKIAQVIADSPKGFISMLPVCNNLIERGVRINPDQVKAGALDYYYNYPSEISSYEERYVKMARVVVENGKRTLILMDRDGFRYSRYERELVDRGNFDGVKINFDPKLPTDILEGPNSLNHHLANFCSVGLKPSKWATSDDTGKAQIIHQTMDYLQDVLKIRHPVRLKLNYDKSPDFRGRACFSTMQFPELQRRGAASDDWVLEFSMAFKDDDPAEALGTIAHEMWHFFQEERANNPQNDLELVYARNKRYYWSSDNGFDQYYDQPIEKEARAFAAQFQDYLPRLSAELENQNRHKYFDKFRRIFS